MSGQLAQSLTNWSSFENLLSWVPQGEFQAPGFVARDQRTLEIRQFYPLPTSNEKVSSYTLDVYFFFPHNFGVTPESWGPEVFYRNARVFSRLHAPTLTLAHLCDMSHALNPAGLLLERINGLLGARAMPGSSMTALAQMFGAELTDAIQRQANFLQRTIRKSKGGGENQRLFLALKSFCADGLGALRQLQRISAEARVYQGVLHPKLLPSLFFAEEYGCAVLDEQLSSLALLIEERETLRDGEGSAVRMRLLIANTLEHLNHWRRERGFVLPQRRDAEYYTYRINLLKKEVQRSLYVNTRAAKRDPFFANSAAMVAAGLAATWAWLAQVPMLTGKWNTREGIFLFGAAVGAYILKDRIKDLVKKRLVKRWIHWDHDEHLIGDSLDAVGLGAFSGRVQERVRWRSDSQIPDEVTKMRRAQRTVQGATLRLEQALHYHRLLTLSGKKASPVPSGYGVQEIFRLAVDDIVRRLDDPNDTVCYFDEPTSSFRCATMPKVYHLNMVYLATDLSTGQRFRGRTRVVLNQTEILRVEPVFVEREVIDTTKRKK